jgi:hypothetical protein
MNHAKWFFGKIRHKYGSTIVDIQSGKSIFLKKRKVVLCARY